MAEDDDLEWLSDYVLAFLKSPSWVAPIAQFVDEQCIVFDNEEENKLEYTQCHNEFKQLIDSLLAAHLLEISVSRDQFEQFCHTGLANNPALHRVLVEQLLSVDDFQVFKAMMSKRNASLFREAQRRVDAGQEIKEEDLLPEAGGITDEEDARLRAMTPCYDFNDTTILDDEADLGATQQGFGLTAAIVAEEWQLYEDQLFKALDDEEDAAAAADRQREEEEIEAAIALSLQMEEDHARAEAAAAVAPSSAPPAAEEPPAVPARPAAPAEVEPQAPPPSAPQLPSPKGSGLPPLRAVLPRVMRVAPLGVRPGMESSPEAAADLQRMRAEAEAILQQEREARAKAFVPAAPAAEEAAAGAPAAPAPPPPAPPAARAQPSEAERKERAEHLRRQRQLLVEKRNKERQRQMGEYARSRVGTPAGPTRPARRVDGAFGGSAAGAGPSLVAELTQPSSSAPMTDTAAAATQMRQALAAQLKQTLVGHYK
eukprot:TRINITY_DN103777_c0_g1_i1.p1 TRINITY_DN103777_c0_g1~~TRINITY_DN103777_c0_g1_i1.p1  ORF type:complete len:484 (+),score=128.44 TRINITY_DN103777_c0_g1_i1:56-1507(+)